MIKLEFILLCVLITLLSCSNERSESEVVNHPKSIEAEIWEESDLNNSVPFYDFSTKKFGLRDSLTDNVLLEPIYDNLRKENRAIIAVDQNKKFLLDKEGRVLIELVDGYMHEIGSDTVLVRKNRLYSKIVNAEGKEYFKSRFVDLRYLYGRYIAKKEDGLYGMFDTKGTILIPFEYSHLSFHVPADYIIGSKDGKSGLFDLKGIEVLPLRFNLIMGMTDSLWSVSSENRWGFYNNYGEEVISLSYENVALPAFSERVCAVKKNGFWGAIDNMGRIIIPFKYKSIGSCTNGKIPAMNEGNHWGVLNVKGETVLPFEYSNLIWCDSDLYRITKGGKNFFIDGRGELVNTKGYDKVFEFKSGYARVRIGNKTGVVDSLGKESVPLEFDGMNLTPKGYFPSIKDGKHGVVNSKGKVLLDFKYSYISNGYANSLIMIKNEDGLYGYVNQDFEIVIVPQFEKARHFNKGYALVLKDERVLKINEQGEIVSESQ